MTEEIKEEMIPYVISTTHPDYKRPYVYNDFGMIEKSKLKQFALESLVEFLDISIYTINSVQDLVYYMSYGYYEQCDSYMDNNCWEMSAVINGEWHTINIKNEEIFNAILEQRKKNKEEEEEESLDN